MRVFSLLEKAMGQLRTNYCVSQWANNVVVKVSPLSFNVREAMRLEWVKFNPAFNVVKFPLVVSKERLVPTKIQLFPTIPEKLTKGFVVILMLVRMPAYSCWYCSSTFDQGQ